MHNAVLVIGDNPVEQLRPLHPDPFDWYAVGGRYSGWLLASPDAITGTIHGDAMPAAEARLLGALDGARRPGPGRGPGVDQACVFDVDLDATLAKLAPTPDESIVIGVMANGRWHQGPLLTFMERGPAEVEAGATKWHQQLQHLLRAAPPEALLTLIDVHW